VCLLILGAAIGGAATSARAQDAPILGTPLANFIMQMREQGITVIYSSDLVTDSMRIVAEPTAEDPIRRLREVLEPHGLALEAGPRGTWLVVKPSVAPPAPAPTPTLQAPTPPIDVVVVSASRYAFGRSTVASTEEIDRVQLENSPTLGEDALRTTHSLPGLTTNGLTARVNVRGGEADETLLLLDGVRLYNPFHLKDFQSLFGSVDPRIIDLIDVRTGGYPAEFGDRMSSVIEMRSLAPEDKRHYEVGISTLTSSVLSSGRFADDRGEWLTSLRRGNLDLLVDAAQSDIGQPQYADFFNKLGYTFGDRLTLTTGVFLSDDKISLSDEDVSEATADYDDTYLWVQVTHDATPQLSARYLASHARLVSYRSGQIDDPDIALGSLSDRRRFEIDALRGDWSFSISDRHRLEWGAEVDSARASYEFMSQRQLPFPIVALEFVVPGNAANAALTLGDHSRAAYVSYRAQALPRVTAELGLRWDDRSYLDEDYVSPRIAVLFDLGERATVRASWGRFYQSQGISEVQVADGLTSLFTAQEAEHAVLSLEYSFSATLSLRAEIYEKKFERVRPRFENLFMRRSLLPELLPDRVMIEPLEAAAEGLELSFEGERDRWQWSLSYARASIDDRLPTRWANRSWEEQWSTKARMIWVGTRWTASANLTARSGWPITDLSIIGTQLVAGPYNVTAFESFRSLDLRASRALMLERGSIEFFIELANALDEENPCCFDYTVGTNAALEPVSLAIDEKNWLPVVPTFGFLWQF
jgi:outer membrane receptor protein involved in Fe transport